MMSPAPTSMPPVIQGREAIKTAPKQIEIKAAPREIEIKSAPKEIEKKPSTSTAAPVSPTSAKSVEMESKNPFELDRRYEKRVGHAADYSKVTGQLSYVHIDGGIWILRYAPLWQEDPNGGSVVLARDRQMENYREGDLVTVEGAVIKPRGSARLGGPLYQVHTIQLDERPQ
jgi:hypothetical protein